MNTYDTGASTHGSAPFWRSLRGLIRRWLDRERELVALRNAVGMMAEARRADAREYHEMADGRRASLAQIETLQGQVRALQARLAHIEGPPVAWVQADSLRNAIEAGGGKVTVYTQDLALSMLPIYAPGVRGTSPPEDSYPDQSILHDEANVGNCLQATIAGVLDWPLESVPHFALLGETHWWDCAQAWLDSQGYWIDYKPDSYTRDGGTLLPRCWLSGQSPRGFSHAVIGDTASGQVLHDPHPTRAGLVAVDYTIYFFRKPSTVFRQPAAGVGPSAQTQEKDHA